MTIQKLNVFLNFYLLCIYTPMLNGELLENLVLPGECHFANVRQLTFGGDCAEAYFSRNDQRIVFQASNFGYQCDQIFKFDLKDGDTALKKPSLVSTGAGRTTCSYFLPDNEHILYASTHLGDQKCPIPPCKNQTALEGDEILRGLCNSTYIWDIYSDYDIFLVNPNDVIEKQLTNTTGYDAEATVSPNGDLIVFTSIRSGDLELWTMKVDGTELNQVTDQLGYDGGAFFSPDGQRLVFRASRPNGVEVEKYKSLLSYNLVSPTDMEIYTVNVNGSDMVKVTNLGVASWAPFYHPSGTKIIFSSNYNNPQGFGFNLFMVNADGSGELEQITHDQYFDSFPMFSYDGRYLIFGSMRNSTDEKVNIFLAEWVGECKTSGAVRYSLTKWPMVIFIIIAFSNFIN